MALTLAEPAKLSTDMLLAGELPGVSGTSDATVVLTAEDGDDTLTSDPVDIEKLVRALGVRVAYSRASAGAYRPLNSGGRRASKAAMPSCTSWV